MIAKYLKGRELKAIQLHNILSIIPFVWFLLFSLILAIGTFKLGYVPKYGNRVDPGDLHIGFLVILHAVFLLLAFFAVLGWVALTIILYSFYKGRYRINKISLRLFTIGVCGFFIFKYVFHSVFARVID